MQFPALWMFKMLLKPELQGPSEQQDTHYLLLNTLPFQAPFREETLVF